MLVIYHRKLKKVSFVLYFNILVKLKQFNVRHKIMALLTIKLEAVQ